MKRTVFLGLALALCSAPVVLEAQDTEWNRYTLEDLGGVFIRIEANPACEAAGVTPAAYQADVSLKLIEAEVGVLTQAEMLAHPALPELRISLDCAAGSGPASGSIGYSVGLRVQQSAQMMRDGQITLPEAVTWFSTAVGVTTPGGAADAVGTTLMSQLEGFATAWTEINAEEGEGTRGR